MSEPVIKKRKDKKKQAAVNLQQEYEERLERRKRLR